MASSRSSNDNDRLADYRAKRDFKVSPEPSGVAANAPPAGGNRFVVQRHRARRLHYDLRLEAAGVLLSWAVPKGPTLDPDVRRMAVHVEDHPLDYFDFEGVIPSGEYGGGDVIVWDWGTWTLAEAKDPLKAVAKGDLHFDLHGDKLGGRFALVRRGPAGSREDWLLIHKHDEHAVTGWDAEDHPRSVKSGRTNDEVKAAPAATWSSTSLWTPPTREELAALDALGPRGGEWTIGDTTLTVTNLTKILMPARRPHRAVTKRDLIRHYVSMAPAILPYVANRRINLHRFPDGIEGKSVWQEAGPDHAVLDSAATLAWAANLDAIELHPWTSTVDRPERPTWAMIDIAPGETTSFGDVLTLGRLYRTALTHLAVEACPKLSGQRGLEIWVPVAERDSFEHTRAWVERLSQIIGRIVPELDFTQIAINATLLAPFSARPAAGAPVSVPITWDELDDPDLRPDRWTIRTIGERLASSGDPLAPLIGRQQRLPELTE